MRPVRLGTGMTHHFALSVPDQDALGSGVSSCNSRGVPVRERLEDEVFPSIVLQDPDGQVIEVVSQTPGLAGDEPPAELGQKASLAALARIAPRRDRSESDTIDRPGTSRQLTRSFTMTTSQPGRQERPRPNHPSIPKRALATST